VNDQGSILTTDQLKAIQAEARGLTFKPSGRGFICNQTGRRVSGQSGCKKYRRRVLGELYPKKKVEVCRVKQVVVARKKVQRDRDGDVFCLTCERWNYNAPLGEFDCRHCGEKLLVSHE
jgi:hypothetical protein